MDLHYFEDISIGDEYIAIGRPLTPEYIINYAGISGDFFPLHIDEEYAKKTEFGTRVAHGLLGLAITDGLKNLSPFQTAGIASLGWTVAFKGPIFPGDTIYVKCKIINMRKSRSKPDRGIIFIGCKTINQRNEIVIEAEHREMIHCRK